MTSSRISDSNNLYSFLHFLYRLLNAMVKWQSVAPGADPLASFPEQSGSPRISRAHLHLSIIELRDFFWTSHRYGIMIIRQLSLRHGMCGNNEISSVLVV